MDTPRPVFQQIYQDYLAQLASQWDSLALEQLGVVRDGEAVLAPLYQEVYRVHPQGMTGPRGEKPSHARAVVLAKYLLARPQGKGLQGEWVSYRSFANAAPYAASFSQYAEGRIAKNHAKDSAGLAEACRGLGGYPVDLGLSYDLCLTLPALPRVPLLMLFNGQEDGFPANCSLLFDQSGPDYLDMECLAILGLILAESLGQADANHLP